MKFLKSVTLLSAALAATPACAAVYDFSRTVDAKVEYSRSDSYFNVIPRRSRTPGLVAGDIVKADVRFQPGQQVRFINDYRGSDPRGFVGYVLAGGDVARDVFPYPEVCDKDCFSITIAFQGLRGHIETVPPEFGGIGEGSFDGFAGYELSNGVSFTGFDFQFELLQSPTPYTLDELYFQIQNGEIFVERVPESGALALLAFGVVTLAATRRRR